MLRLLFCCLVLVGATATSAAAQVEICEASVTKSATGAYCNLITNVSVNITTDWGECPPLETPCSFLGVVYLSGPNNSNFAFVSTTGLVGTNLGGGDWSFGLTQTYLNCGSSYLHNIELIYLPTLQVGCSVDIDLICDECL
jgi:hypothetical protein